MNIKITREYFPLGVGKTREYFRYKKLRVGIFTRVKISFMIMEKY